MELTTTIDNGIEPVIGLRDFYIPKHCLRPQYRGPIWINATSVQGKRASVECVGYADEAIVGERACKYLNLPSEETKRLQDEYKEYFGSDDLWPGVVSLAYEIRRPDFDLRKIDVHAHRHGPGKGENRVYHYDVRLWSLEPIEPEKLAHKRKLEQNKANKRKKR